MAVRARRARARTDAGLKRRVITGVLAAALVSAAVVLASGWAATESVGCGTCHAMRPYTEAHATGGHVDVACASCHVAEGLATLPAEGLRAVGWGVSALLGRTPVPASAGDRACRACHEPDLGTALVARGIAVRHSDFSAQPCSFCHSGTAHQIPDRHYRVPEMDDCTGCHASVASDPDACDLCHQGEHVRREGVTSWRSTHGAGWETTHGMGDLTGCTACHAPGYCVRCHGVRVPHPREWVTMHGQAAVTEAGDGCLTCHEEGWCTSCHGVKMPHEDGFFVGHGPIATELGEERCGTCHPAIVCQACHYLSTHPALPEVSKRHGGDRFE